MNITISKKLSKSQQPLQFNQHHQNTRLLSQNNQQSSTKVNYTRTSTQANQMDICSKWLFQKCLNDSKDQQNNQSQAKKMPHLRLTKTLNKKLNSKQIDKQPFKKSRQTKINILSYPKQQYGSKNGNLQNLRAKLQNSNKINLLSAQSSKNCRKGEQKSDMLQTKQCTGVNPSIQNSRICSVDRVEVTVFPDVPDILSNRILLQPASQKKQPIVTQRHLNFPDLFLVDQRIDIQQNAVSIKDQQQKATPNMKQQKNQDLNMQVNMNDEKSSLENYNIIGQSFSDATNQVDHFRSVYLTTNTQLVKRKIDFSQIKPHKIPLARSKHQNLSCLDQKKQNSIKSPYRKLNRQSKFVHSIKVSQQSSLNSRYFNLDQSFVLEKGLIEIFSHNFNTYQNTKQQQLLNSKLSKTKLLNKLSQPEKQQLLSPIKPIVQQKSQKLN